ELHEGSVARRRRGGPAGGGSGPRGSGRRAPDLVERALDRPPDARRVPLEDRDRVRDARNLGGVALLQEVLLHLLDDAASRRGVAPVDADRYRALVGADEDLRAEQADERPDVVLVHG